MTAPPDLRPDDGPAHLRDIDDLAGHLDAVLDLGAALKAAHRAGEPYHHLPDRTLAMVFEKPSTRTRVAFETGMTNLGGHALYLGPTDIGLGEREPLADTARVLSRYVDAVMIRMGDHGALVEFAADSAVPVVNGLTDDAHPCQVLADLLTIRESFGGFDLSAAWVGDGNNVARSFVLGCAMAGIELTVATPEGYEVGDDVLERAAELGAAPETTTDPAAAVSGADAVYTDVWVSMGDEAERAERLRDFEGFQVNDELLAAAPDARVMHCLPAHRGEEITSAVLDSDRSLAWDQAENRMHAQNGLLCALLL